MDMHADILSFLDLLALDEEIIDSRIKSILLRSNHTNMHLSNAIRLLQYKNLINVQENSDCDNNVEFEFTIQLLRNVNHDNVDCICKIIYTVLCLNTTNLINKSEHVIQQILSNLDISSKEIDKSSAEGDNTSKIYLDLRVCESVLDAVIAKNEQVSLLFMNTPLEELISCTDEKLKLYFMTNIVPKLFESVVGYNILDRIWNYIKQAKEENKYNSLKILSCLSHFYLPTPDTIGRVIYESEIIYFYEFWDIVLYGMLSNDSSTRKISIYLSKRAIDCVLVKKKDICVQTEKRTIFRWTENKSKHFKNMWDNYFVLIDSLEEKQSNIVLPSLKLFESLFIEECWLNAAFNIGLKHDSTQVRLMCIKYRLMHKIKDQSVALVLLEAFNDTNIFEHIINCTLDIKIKMTKLLEDHVTLLEILKAIPDVKWSPVPFYFITDVISNLETKVEFDIADIITNIIKVSCTHMVIRKAAYYNVAQFIINNCVENHNWKDIIHFYSIIQHYSLPSNPLESKLKNIILNEETKYSFFNVLSGNSSYIDLILIYLSEHENYLHLFIEILNKKFNEVNDIVNRQYSNKSECLDTAVFLLNLISRTRDSKSIAVYNLHELSVKDNKLLLTYVMSLFSSDINLSIDVCVQLFAENNYMGEELADSLLQLYKTCILFLKDISELDKAVLSIFAFKMLLKHQIINNKYRHEIINLMRFLDIVSDFKFKEPLNQSGVGRWKNVFYEKSCEIIYIYIEERNNVKDCIKPLINYLENVLECGGYGCLKWILKIVNKIIKQIIDEENFNITQFINKAWNEIEELKTNNQYSICIEEFTELITQDALLEKAVYNNLVTSYCCKIIEYGAIKTNPLYYLTRKLNKTNVTKYSHLVYNLLDILLYCPGIRKDDRITNNVSLQILKNSKYGINQNSLDTHFNYEVQYLSIKTLCSINEVETLNIIIKLLTNKIDESFCNKQRYHGGSQPHKMLQLTLQHILMISLKNCGNLHWLVDWCLDLLVKLPHQPSVRICLEWLVALYFYVKKTELNEETLKILKDKNTPLISQFFIFHWVLKHKISNKTFTDKEYEFVQDYLLSHTMGQLFNVRLNAQYLATVLHRMVKKTNKYDYTIHVIEKTFEDSKADKSLLKLKKDYFANNFDVITNLNPYFIYYLLPKYCDHDDSEKVDMDYIKHTSSDIVKNIDIDEKFKNEWTYNDMEDLISHSCDESDSKVLDNAAELGTIQKKYIPWRNMSDINVNDTGKKVVSSSDLIVVASLIDKLPNLGGMARTSEVFGVKTYVMDSLRHLLDKQFQGLSVSAERWINIEEIRPGQALRDYLLQKKTEGYTVVAAEQTSTSSKLQSFKFPKKTLLLLGHEKAGVPCDLLPLMDHCVEIPQQGFVRSLNVHVTAAIFIWEYARQNML